jgi:hypothetical protein
MLRDGLFIAALFVTAFAIYLWAVRMRALGLQTMEWAAKRRPLRYGNSMLAVGLWVAWYYI